MPPSSGARSRGGSGFSALGDPAGRSGGEGGETRRSDRSAINMTVGVARDMARVLWGCYRGPAIERASVFQRESV